MKSGGGSTCFLYRLRFSIGIMAGRSALGRVATGVAGGVAGGAMMSFDTWTDLVKPYIPAALDFLKSSAAPKEALMSAAEVHAVALKATVEAFTALLKAQQNAGTPLWKLLLAIGLPAAACGYALHQLGWANVGWVTPTRFEMGMSSVVEQVSTKISGLGDMMHFEFLETTKAVQEVKTELSAEIQAVSERIERRLEPVEADSRRSAKGIEVLCELVASSGLLNNASATSLHKLDEFTGESAAGGRGEEAAARPTRAPAELPAPEGAMAPSTFMRAIMAEPPTAPGFAPYLASR